MLPQSIQKYKLHAKKSLGQNFLVDEGSLENIATAIEVDGKNIVEVGPGYGALTEKLLTQIPQSLTLVELDPDMITILEQRIQTGELQIEGLNVNIEHIDVLKYEPIFHVCHSCGGRNLGKSKDTINDSESSSEGQINYSVIANIPYYITSPILRHFLYEVSTSPQEMAIMMQEDVGRKILSGQRSICHSELVSESGKCKGTNYHPVSSTGGHRSDKKIRSSVLGLFIAKKCFVREVCVVPKEHFYPAPKVESIVLHFITHDNYRDIDDGVFLEIIKQGFREPRKKLLKNLLNSGYDKGKILVIFEKLSISDTVRGEELGIEEWIEVVKELEIDERGKIKEKRRKGRMEKGKGT